MRERLSRERSLNKVGYGERLMIWLRRNLGIYNYRGQGRIFSRSASIFPGHSVRRVASLVWRKAESTSGNRIVVRRRDKSGSVQTLCRNNRIERLNARRPGNSDCSRHGSYGFAILRSKRNYKTARVPVTNFAYSFYAQIIYRILRTLKPHGLFAPYRGKRGNNISRDAKAVRLPGQTLFRILGISSYRNFNIITKIIQAQNAAFPLIEKSTAAITAPLMPEMV